MPKYLRRPAVTERYALPSSTLYDWIKQGLFPRPVRPVRPVRLGARAVGWSVEELEAWERDRAAERDRGSK